MAEARFNATVETAGNPVEAVAVAARALFTEMYPLESWDELTGQADQSMTPALARQAVFMRAARAGVDAYGRSAAGIRHDNPLSRRERQRLAQVWRQIIADPQTPGLRRAAKHAGAHLDRYEKSLSGRLVTGGYGPVSVMVRDYSRVTARLTGGGDG
jgi:hypothetical protein